MRKEHAPRSPATPWRLPALGLIVALVTAAPFASAQEAKSPAVATATPVPATATATAAANPPNAQAPAGVQPQGEEDMAEAEEVFYEPLQVGDATQGLLAWQRSGEIASATPRPIAGAVANRSYERYLKSFEFPIPERMSSIVKSSTSGGSGAGSAR